MPLPILSNRSFFVCALCDWTLVFYRSWLFSLHLLQLYTWSFKWSTLTLFFPLLLCWYYWVFRMFFGVWKCMLSLIVFSLSLLDILPLKMPLIVDFYHFDIFSSYEKLFFQIAKKLKKTILISFSFSQQLTRLCS